MVYTQYRLTATTFIECSISFSQHNNYTQLLYRDYDNDYIIIVITPHACCSVLVILNKKMEMGKKIAPSYR